MFYSLLLRESIKIRNLSFGLSSSDSEEFAPQILGFSDEVNGQGPFTSLKSTRGASKLTESEGEKPKTQVRRGRKKDQRRKASLS